VKLAITAGRSDAVAEQTSNKLCNAFALAFANAFTFQVHQSSFAMPLISSFNDLWPTCDMPAYAGLARSFARRRDRGRSFGYAFRNLTRFYDRMRKNTVLPSYRVGRKRFRDYSSWISTTELSKRSNCTNQSNDTILARACSRFLTKLVCEHLVRTIQRIKES